MEFGRPNRPLLHVDPEQRFGIARHRLRTRQLKRRRDGARRDGDTRGHGLRFGGQRAGKDKPDDPDDHEQFGQREPG